MVLLTEYLNTYPHRRAAPPRHEKEPTALCPRCGKFVGPISVKHIPVVEGKCSVDHTVEEVGGVICYAVPIINCDICAAEVPVRIGIH